jgi:hypothetical protein
VPESTASASTSAIPAPQKKDPAKTRISRPCSPAQWAANKANGCRSRGPVSPEGKAIARLNGLVHGACAKLPILMPDENPEDVQGTIDLWYQELNACTDAERQEVQNAIFGHLKMRRCLNAEGRAITGKIAVLAETFDDRKAAEARALVDGLALDPAAALQGLRSGPHGVIHLVDQWTILEESLPPARSPSPGSGSARWR